MRRRGGVQSLDAFRGEGHRSIGEVVIDGLGHAHHAQALLLQRVGNAQQTVTADRNQRIKAFAPECTDPFRAAVFQHHAIFLLPHRIAERVTGNGRVKNNAAQWCDALHAGGVSGTTLPALLGPSKPSLPLRMPTQSQT